MILVGGGTGATAGGIKQFRVYAFYRGLLWEVRRMLLPKNTVTEPDLWQGDRHFFLSDKQLRTIGSFVFLYVVSFSLGSAIIAA